MAIKFQYNKTSLGDMGKQLKMRTNALPTLKSKEAALRAEVQKSKDMAGDFEEKQRKLIGSYEYMTALWGEFDPDLVKIADVGLGIHKIAGVRIPVLKEVMFDEKKYDLFSSPIWFADGVELLKKIARLKIEYEFYARKTALLDYARKKTTQKVNLYEKVQIPGYEAAILKIRRFLEDEENLSKSAQKIVKNRQDQAAKQRTEEAV